MNAETPTTTPASRTEDLRAIATELVDRLVTTGAQVAQGLLQPASGPPVLAVLVRDSAGPARLLVGPYGRAATSLPKRVHLDGLEVAAVARALDSCCDAG